MGKSPGRWIKTVLFGKKHSKSKNATVDRKSVIKTSAEENYPVISIPSHFPDKDAKNMELEKSTSATPGATIASVPVDCCFESKNNFVSVPVSDDEMRRQVQAATKAQAVFRGYSARRAFKALKGIIRLQALIRGHLVRRQAIATLLCMQGIVKFQGLARARRVRLSNNVYHVDKKYTMEELQQEDIGAHSNFGPEKLINNAYVRKLLLSMPIAMPLSLQYDSDELNSAWSWLERWSGSHFREPPQPRKVSSVKSQRKLVGSQIVENEAGKLKTSIRNDSTTANGDNGAIAFFETEKPKRNPRKVTSHQTELVQELSQSELERVKCNLRKISASVAFASEKSETGTEKPQQQLSSETVLSSASPDVSEKDITISAEKPTGSDVIADRLAQLEDPSKTVMSVEPVDALNDDQMESAPFLYSEVSPKADESGKEEKKIRKRRSLPAKQECPEITSLNTRSLPSYMAATQSAKAKLRIQGSCKISEDEAEVGYVRRHSLPASANGRLTSLSPRIQKPDGKGISKINRPVTSTRDEKVVQPGWRR